MIVCDLSLDAHGLPAAPLSVIDLDKYREADEAMIAASARAVARSLRVTVGVLAGAASDRLRPLLEALTCSLGAAAECRETSPPTIIPVVDIEHAVEKLRDTVATCPQASIALAQLLRQTAMLDPYSGLAAEASVYSMLLSGREFQKWRERRSCSRAAEAAEGPRVRVERRGDELDLVLDRPDRHNALDARMREELYEALYLAAADTDLKVRLSGAGKSFCSGGDLAEFGVATDTVAAYLVRLDRAPWRLLEGIRDRVHVYLQGAAIGAGIEIAAFAARTTAAASTRFQLPELEMGLVPGAGGTVSVTRRIGRWRAAWLMLTGTIIEAETALDWGLVDAVEVQA